MSSEGSCFRAGPKISSLYSALTFSKLSGHFAKWATIVLVARFVVPEAAMKKSTSSSMMNSSVKISGGADKKTDKRSEPSASSEMFYPLFLFYTKSLTKSRIFLAFWATLR